MYKIDLYLVNWCQNTNESKNKMEEKFENLRVVSRQRIPKKKQNKLNK